MAETTHSISSHNLFQLSQFPLRSSFSIAHIYSGSSQRGSICHDNKMSSLNPIALIPTSMSSSALEIRRRSKNDSSINNGLLGIARRDSSIGSNDFVLSDTKTNANSTLAEFRFNSNPFILYYYSRIIISDFFKNKRFRIVHRNRHWKTQTK